MILAGGLGTRLRPATELVPKAMMPVGGRPFLDYELELLKAGGIDDLVLCIGHLGEMIRSRYGDGRKLGVSISYSLDGPKLLGPAGALKRAEPLLQDSFFVTYGDAFLRLDYRAMMKRLLASRELGLMAVFRNDGAHGTSDLLVKGGRVVRYDKKGGRSMRWINFGVSALRRASLAFIPPGREVGEEEFYRALIARKELRAFSVRNRFYEIGNPASLEEFERFISRGQQS